MYDVAQCLLEFVYNTQTARHLEKAAYGGLNNQDSLENQNKLKNEDNLKTKEDIEMRKYS